ncbi:MAG TPA: DUF3793 family protein [Firmicutes bacterium]|nr:DUF3793 family protein [Bacillota bacterium]
MLEQKLIAHCAPTLASLKTASLFNVNCGLHEQLISELAEWNCELGPKGIVLTVLGRVKEGVLIYVYRRSRLEQDLHHPGVNELLSACGYEYCSLDGALETLKSRLVSAPNGFPHEIGVFLGYPIEDVKGFIRHKGRNSKCVGCWKVYSDQCEAERAFAKFNKCREVYMRLWNQGRSVQQLTVAV